MKKRKKKVVFTDFRSNEKSAYKTKRTCRLPPCYRMLIWKKIEHRR